MSCSVQEQLSKKNNKFFIFSRSSMAQRRAPRPWPSLRSRSLGPWPTYSGKTCARSHAVLKTCKKLQSPVRCCYTVLCTTVDQFLPPPFRATPPPLYCAIDASPSPFWAGGGRLYGDLWGIQGRRLRVKPNQEKNGQSYLGLFVASAPKEKSSRACGLVASYRGGPLLPRGQRWVPISAGGRRCLEERRERRSREGGV